MCRETCPQIRDHLASAAHAAALDAERRDREGLERLADAIQNGDTALQTEAAQERRKPLGDVRRQLVGAMIRDRFGPPCARNPGLVTAPDLAPEPAAPSVSSGTGDEDLVTILPPAAGSIEQLLQRHPQTQNQSPFALGVARCLREPLR